MSERIGLIQGLVSDYERDKLRLHAEMVIRFARVLEVTIDELLGVKASKDNGNRLSLKLLRRAKKIETLPPSQQKTLLKTIDIFLKGAQK